MQKLSMEQLGRLSVEEYKKTSKTPVVVVLDNVRSALNVGSVLEPLMLLNWKKLCFAA